MRESESVCVRVCVRCVCVWGVGRCCGGSLGRVGIVQNTEIGVGVSFPSPLPSSHSSPAAAAAAIRPSASTPISTSLARRASTLRSSCDGCGGVGRWWWW